MGFGLLVLVALSVTVGAHEGHDESEHGRPLQVETFEWFGGNRVVKTAQDVQPLDACEEHSHQGGHQKQAKSKTHSHLNHRNQRRISESNTEAATENAMMISALWDRPAWRDHRLDLKAAEGEHPCFAGWKYMIESTNRCNGWTRQYPEVGGQVTFKNTGVYRYSKFTLKAVVAGNVNVWVEEGSTALHEDIAIKAANIYTNQYDIEELKPAEGSNSWMEHECKIMGSMPFMYTCSNRINILVQECNVENAWVMSSDYLRNFPDPANADSPANHDIVFYMCQEMLDGTPNPYAAANTFAHELAHVIQGGFGSSFTAMTEGGATWLEGPLLNLPPRPMVYAWGFQDWNRINAAHLYANTVPTNSRKFYQIHSMFLTYLSQPELLGDKAASALQNYESFEDANVPFGRAAYDYYLTYLGRPQPSTFEPVILNATDVFNSFATALLDYRVAIASQCILEAANRPTEARYNMPAKLQEHPYWDCSSYPTYWSAEQTTVEGGVDTQIHYGGAAIARLATPAGATISMGADADPYVRTKILASAAPSSGHAAVVSELRPGQSLTLEGGARDIYVVQVNVDPAGELLGPNDRNQLWKKGTHGCQGHSSSSPCRGNAWRATGAHGRNYPADSHWGLRSASFAIPASATNAKLTFDAMWDLEDSEGGGERVGSGCSGTGYDGVQVRLHVMQANSDKINRTEVIVPVDGYDSAVCIALAASALAIPGADCSSYQGWLGSTLNADETHLDWTNQEFSLAKYAGETVKVEIIFASDGSVGGQGFWMTNMKAKTGNTVLFREGHGQETSMETYYYSASTPAGSKGRVDGVPVVAQLPDGYEYDQSMSKDQTRSAAWTASWATPEATSEAARARAHLGWSYRADTHATKSARLHPSQEACLTLQAPFKGSVDSATLFLLVDKMGVGAVSLSMRSAESPHNLLTGSEVMTSASPSVEDPGTHRFKYSGSGPVLEENELFLMCIGIAEIKTLPADDTGSLPFLHMPLLPLETTATKGVPGATMLLVPPTPGQQHVRAVQTSGLDPFQGQTFALRAEFVAAASSSSSGADRSRAFLAP